MHGDIMLTSQTGLFPIGSLDFESGPALMQLVITDHTFVVCILIGLLGGGVGHTSI